MYLHLHDGGWSGIHSRPCFFFSQWGPCSWSTVGYFTYSLLINKKGDKKAPSSVLFRRKFGHLTSFLTPSLFSSVQTIDCACTCALCMPDRTGLGVQWSPYIRPPSPAATPLMRPDSAGTDCFLYNLPLTSGHPFDAASGHLFWGYLATKPLTSGHIIIS